MRILVPIDLDDAGSQRALPVAERMAAETGGELVLLTVGERAETSVHRETAEEQIRERLEAVAARVTGVPVQLHVALSGDPVRGILRTAEQQRIDRVVMAAEQQGGWQALFGDPSVADEVVEEPSPPVYLVDARGDVTLAA